MCGIIGYIGRKEANEVILDGLKRLEYRGYDSAGLAILSGGTIHRSKVSGKIAALEERISSRDFTGTLGIGHTRWATHGEPSQVNAHPHFDCTGRIALVHNGIIENYYELKADLLARGHVFASETDSEVVAHLIEEQYNGSMEDALRKALRLVRGSFALAVISREEPDTIFGARLNCPLIVGVGDGAGSAGGSGGGSSEEGRPGAAREACLEREYFLASDIPAILPYTKKIIYMGEGEIVSLSRRGVRIVDLGGNLLAREASTITWSLEQAEKSGHPHFMLKEIHEQPEAIEKTLLDKLDGTRGRVFFKDLALGEAYFRSVERIITVSCGTAYHAGLVAKYAIEDLARIPVQPEMASEFRYGSPVLGERTLVLAITQSGETADTLAGVREARRRGSKVVTVCNVVGSSIPRESDVVLYTHAGPEIGVASTKAYTTQLVTVILLAAYLGELRDVLDRERAKSLIEEVTRLPALARTVLETEPLIVDIAHKFKDPTTYLYIGRRYNFPTAFEGALKLKEISYIHAEGYGAGEMKHGPIALVEESFPTVALAPKGRVYEKMISNIQEIRARRGKVIAVATEGDEEIRKHVDYVIPLPEMSEMLSPVIAVIPLQLLAYHIAVLRGCDVDQPRNLAKSVTVE
jgi:glucosamine--fructose-6-phosphate aminotransferase (isomerizing)